MQRPTTIFLDVNETLLDLSPLKISVGKANGSGSVTVVNVGEAETDPTIRKALAIGANDAIRVNAAPRDAFFVSKQIAKVAADGQYDMILTGRESIDFNGARVCAMVGELMDIPSVSVVKKMDIADGKAKLEREIEGGKEVVEVSLPFVASATEGIAEPRIPNMRGIMSARTKPLNVVDAVDADTLTEINGFDQPSPRSAVKLVDAENTDELIDLLHSEAKVI